MPSLKIFISIVVLLISCKTVKKESQKTSPQQENNYRTGELIYQDDFNNNLSNYILEFPDSPNSSIEIKNGKLVIDVDGGTTVWLNKKLKGDIQIEYSRKVIVEGGYNDRLSDFNQFWMATDPRNKNLFTRTGIFHEYDSLLLYYFGFGGNTNTTTRFRKYTGDGNRVLIHDLSEQEFLLKPNKTYTIKTIVHQGTTKVFIDNQEFTSYHDPNPLKEGYFGFRTTESKHEIDNLRIYSLIKN